MNPGMSKRQREMARRQRAQEKSARKQQRQADKKAQMANVPEGEDPDLVGIVAGPQPREEDALEVFDGNADEPEDDEG